MVIVVVGRVLCGRVGAPGRVMLVSCPYTLFFV